MKTAKVILMFLMLLVTDLFAGGCGYVTGALDKVWDNPPESAKPWTFWYWMHNNVTKEGIKADLEAMAEHGIGGVYLFSVGGGNAKTEVAVVSMTDLWWEHVNYAIAEADRLGLKVRLNACDGWATAAAPEITPELSMQQLTWSNTVVEAGQSFRGKLPRPTAKRDYYRDIAVLAYPEMVSNPKSSVDQEVEITSSYFDLDLNCLIKGEGAAVELPKPGWFQYEFDEPIACRSVTIVPSRRSYQAMRLELQVSDDGKVFRSLGHLPVPRHGWQDIYTVTSAIAETKSRFFRFVYDPNGSECVAEDIDYVKNPGVGLSQVVVSESPVIHHWRGKAGFAWRKSDATSRQQLPDEFAVPFEEIVDLTDQMQADGSISFKAAESKRRWIIQRIGYTTTGKMNGPAGGGVGLEADKFNRDSVDVQVDSWFGKAVSKNKSFAGKTLVGTHTDSWECGCQNYSPVFREEFIKRRGYDLVKYLPVMTSVGVQSAEVSERFLHDVRQTISELVCDNFYVPMVEKVHGLANDFSAECIAPTMLSDGMALFGRVDIPMGEFWYESLSHDKPTDILDAIHGARIYGKPIVQAEAFTQINLDFDDDPFAMKTLGDHNFALGINRFVLHVWALKALNQKPGITLGGVGAEYSRGQTWWPASRPWFDYLMRCQAILQMGRPVIDVLYYVGEDQPTRSLLPDRLVPELPAGFSYASINRDGLLNQVKVKNRKLCLPGGVKCSVLVLSQCKSMTPEVALKIAELSKKGAVIIGPKPSCSPSLTNYPQCDEQIRQIVADGWGKVKNAFSLGSVLKKLHIKPDLTFVDVDNKYRWHAKEQYNSPDFSWCHRENKEGEDIYFISNQQYGSREVEAVFRVSGKQPELWCPDTGKCRDLTDWSEKDGLTSVPLEFEAGESYFVVFRKAASEPQVKTANFPKFDVLQDIKGQWEVTFGCDVNAPEPVKMGKLESLHKSTQKGVKYFSGEVTYKNQFKFDGFGDNRGIYLDLGKVANLAEVTVNGQTLGCLWKPPFRINISKALRNGQNELKIKVFTTWHNRLVGDVDVEVGGRVGLAPLFPLSRMKNRDLIDSGLMGPVRLFVEQ